jgi:hypothetical protein
MKFKFISLMLLAVLGLVAVPAGPAQAAPTCWGDWCSGQDPYSTRCREGAYPVADSGVYGLTGMHVWLFWSPACKTNWTETNFGPANFQWLEARQPSTGYKQGYSSNNGVAWWSKQIYSPTRCVYSSVGVMISLGYWGETTTWCV